MERDREGEREGGREKRERESLNKRKKAESEKPADESKVLVEKQVRKNMNSKVTFLI